VKFKEIASRLTGLSCPIFGVQWKPPEADRAIARRVLAYLEDRRVLYVPSELESPPHCVDSVIQIRGFLTSELGRLTKESELSNSLRCMRAACRKFLTTVDAEDRRKIIEHSHHHGHFASWVFMSAIGEMRGVFGLHIARLAAAHGLDIEDDLAVIVPFKDNDR